tara:strand:- start:111 stop:335 length:225 start_codon:yes stop_codon:yes gene_type:complete
MTEKSNVIQINDKKYDGSDLTKEQKYCIEQIQECQTEAHRLKKLLDRTTVSQNVFTNNLIELLKDKEVKDDQSQ